MSITVEAIYENGVLKPVRALPLVEHQKVEITVKTPGRVRQSAGLMGWNGSQEDADFVATSPELDHTRANAKPLKSRHPHPHFTAFSTNANHAAVAGSSDFPRSALTLVCVVSLAPNSVTGTLASFSTLPNRRAWAVTSGWPAT